MIIRTNIDAINKYLNSSLNEDIEERIKYFNNTYYSEMDHILILEGSKINGILAYQESFSRNNSLHLEYISLDCEYQGLGFSNLLLKEFCIIAKEENKSISIGSLSSDGELKIKNKIKELSKKFNINIFFE